MSKRDLFSDIWRAANIMRTDDGTNGIYQYIEQISWMFFLKVFEDLEDRFEAEHELESKIYDRLIPKEYSWSQWTKIDYKKQEILEFIDKKLFPFLASLEGTPERNTIGSIFSEVKNNKMTSSYNLKDVIDIIDEINFNNPEDSHILSRFYEDLLVKLGRESGIAGEIYTPRPIVRLMVKIVDPKLNLSNRRTSTILDPFCGSCGFLIESYKHMIEEENVTAKDYRELQRRVFHGAEKKSLPFLVGVMNCILHGLLAPNIIRKNSLNENIDNFGPGDTFDYIFTNPPFGAKEGKNIQENFPVKIRKTELLALQSVMRRLNYGGKCAIVVPEPILWRSDKYLKVRKDLLNNYNIHTIISLPAGVFANVTSSGLGPKTNLLFFEKQGITKEIWYYELTPPRSKNYSRVNTVKDKDLVDCFNKWQKREESSNSWIVKREEIDDEECDLTANNPNVILGFRTQDPKRLVYEIMEKEGRVPSYLEKIDRILYDGNRNNEIFENWSYYRIEKCLEDHGIQSGFACSRKHLTEDGLPHLRPYNVGVNGKLDLSEVAYLPEKMVDTKLYGLKKGDIIFNNTNSKELVGKSAIVEQDLHCGFSNHLTRLRVKTSMVRPEWFLLTLRLHWLSGYFLKKSRKWIGQAGVNPDAILRIEIPVPPVHIQSKIIDDIQKSTQCMEEIYKLQQEIENNMNVLRPSIFKYFILNKS